MTDADDRTVRPKRCRLTIEFMATPQCPIGDLPDWKAKEVLEVLHPSASDKAFPAGRLWLSRAVVEEL